MADPADAPRAPADAPQRYVASTRDGRSVAIEVRDDGPRSIATLALWDRESYTCAGPPDRIVSIAMRLACELVAPTHLVECVAATEPTRAQLLAERDALRRALQALVLGGDMVTCDEHMRVCCSACGTCTTPEAHGPRCPLVAARALLAGGGT